MNKEVYKILGAPGTGKTTRLIGIVEEQMVRGVQPYEIVFSSFTRAAVHEARNRTLDKFGGSVNDFPYFNTEHSICYRLLGLSKDQVFNRRRLKEFGGIYGYAYSWDSSGGNRFDIRYQEAMLQTLGDYCEFFIQFWRDNMLSFDSAYLRFIKSNDVPSSFNIPKIKEYIDRRNQYKQENKLWDFSDMIVGVIERRLVPEGMRVLILDEMQDSSRLLWELAKMWADNAEKVYFAGDPLQTLYFWSGASPELFYELKAEEEVLKVSHRLTNEVKDYAKGIIDKTHYPFPDFDSSGRSGNIIKTSFNSIDWRNVDESFLLIRTRYLISKVTDKFISLGLPFISERGKESPLVTREGKAFNALLKLRGGGQVATSELAILNHYIKKPFIEHGTKAAVERLSQRQYNKSQLTSIGYTDEFIKMVSTDNFVDILSMGIDDSTKSYLLRVSRKYGNEVFEKEPKLTVTTMHGSKGREKKDVYLMPDMTTRVWDGYMKERDPESLVYYVACTRSINNLTILIPQTEYFFLLPEIRR